MTYNDETKEQNVNEPDMAGYYDASDYLKWTFEGFVELIRGKIYKMSSPASAHQKVSGRLAFAYHKYFEHQICDVWTAPFDVYLIKPGEDYKRTRNIVQPDICVVCDRKKIKRLGCVGSPDLVIEILSPSNTRKDVDYKFSLYEEYGVKEYWIVHPAEGTIIVNILKDGRYRPSRPQAKGEILSSVLFRQLTIDLEIIFADLEFED